MDVESSPIYSHATILDPRFKTQGFRIKVKAQIAKSTLISDTHEETRTPEPDNQDSGQTEQPAVSTEQTGESWGDVLFEPALTDDSGSEAADEGVRRTHKGADWCILEGAAAGRGKDPLKFNGGILTRKSTPCWWTMPGSIFVYQGRQLRPRGTDKKDP